MPPILIVDGKNMAWASCCTPPLTTSEGAPTNGIFNFLGTLIAAATELEPEKMFVCWDGARSQERLNLYPDYKAGRDEKRKATPALEAQYENFLLQQPEIHKIPRLLGLYDVRGSRMEADDLIAILALQAEASGKDAAIVSSDKDFLQLLSPRISIYNPIANNAKIQRPKIITIHNMETFFGMPPGQWLEYRALIGDSGDNISGVKGIGEKTAQKLLKSFGSVENFVRADVKKGKAEQFLCSIEGQTAFGVCKKIMDLRKPCCAPDDFATVRMESYPPDLDTITEFLRKHELATLLMSLPQWIQPFKNLKHEYQQRPADVQAAA